MDGKKSGGGETGKKSASPKPQRGSDTKIINVIIDANVLDCSICFTPSRPPLFQCRSGHVACSSCWAKLKNKCSVCSLPTSNSRCRAPETIIESMKIPCPHYTFGCQDDIPYIEKDTHKESCPFAPCSCPVSSCTFRCPTSLLSGHLQNEHSSTTTQISFSYDRSFKVDLEIFKPFYVLHGEDDRIFLLLNDRCYFKPRGNYLSIACMRPGSAESDVGYEITVKGEGSELQLKGSPKNIRKWKGRYPAESILFVPHESCDLFGVICVSVLIRKM